MSRSDHTLPTELFELDMLARFGLPPDRYEWGPLVYRRCVGRALHTRTRRAGSFKHRERRRWWHSERQRVRQDLREGLEPARTLTRNTVRYDLW